MWPASITVGLPIALLVEDAGGIFLNVIYVDGEFHIVAFFKAADGAVKG